MEDITTKQLMRETFKLVMSNLKLTIAMAGESKNATVQAIRSEALGDYMYGVSLVIGAEKVKQIMREHAPPKVRDAMDLVENGVSVDDAWKAVSGKGGGN